MGVWSSIRTDSSIKQMLNIDSDSFSTTVLQDVREIRIQESDEFENSAHSLSNYQNEESLDCPTYFEYSMGGNLKFYREHLQQDFEMENQVFSIKNQRQRLRKSSHSDNDSEPEALRYVRKPQEKVVPVVNTISEEPELSFDDYSSIYQPEFMLNINSKSLVKEIPKHGFGDNKERDNNEGIEDKIKNNEHEIANWSQNFIEDSSPENIAENLKVQIISKSNNLPAVKQNIMSKSQEHIFDYSSSLVETKRNGKQLKNQECVPAHEKKKGNQEIKSVEEKSKRNEEMKLVKRDQNKTKNKIVTSKPRQPKTVENSAETNFTVKTILSKENSSLKKTVNHMAPLLPKKNESKKGTKHRMKKTLERKETPKKLLPNKEINSDASIPCLEKNTFSTTANYQASVKPQENFLSRLNIDTTSMFNNIDLFEELEMTTEKIFSEPKQNKDADFYPESPISELHFFKTPCSTRHNSLETFERLESECIEDSVQYCSRMLNSQNLRHHYHLDDLPPQASPLDSASKALTVNFEELEKPQDNTRNLPFNCEKLPKEFQEMARRLSKKDSPKKSSTSSNPVNAFQNFNCSSSTCSTMSPRSPSGRTLFRTPSYKMPKTPSLSRQHPSTYVTQHTSSRSRSSSRVSSRAASPTREHIEALL